MSWLSPMSWFGGSGNSRHAGYQNENPNGYSSSAAASVSFDSAMTLSAFWACTRVLTETLAAMPIKCYRRMPDGSRQEDRSYRLWRTLNYQPNRYQTRTEFFENMMLNLVTSGNSYAEITSGGYVPLMSVQMQVQLLRDGSIQYEYTDFNSTKRIIPESNIWHVKLFGNSIVGMSPLGYARQSIGVSLATENRVGKIAKNGGKVSGLLSIDHVLNEKQRAAVRKNMEGIAEGDTDTLKILEADMKFQQTALSPQDLQMLESRRFNVEDIARFMGVPSVLINDTAGSTTWGSGIEQIINGFYKINMKPYLERFESSLKRHLIPRSDWDTIDIEFDFDSLLRASKQDRMTAKSVAINSGQLTPNEARNDEGLEDKEGGDDIYLNGSLVKAGTEPETKEIIEVEDENDQT